MCAQPYLSLLLLILGFSMHTATAQNLNDTHQKENIQWAVIAAKHCQTKQYDLALQYIDSALQNEIEKESIYTWYVKGFVHKEIYKTQEINSPTSKQRELAVEALLHSRQLTGDLPDVYNYQSVLKFLRLTYYNDALKTAGNFTMADENLPNQLLNQYNALCQLDSVSPVNPSEFYKQQGMRYYQHWKSSPCNNQLHEKAAESFRLAIEHNGTDCDLYYNAGVIEYGYLQNYDQQLTMECAGAHLPIEKLKKAIAFLEMGQKICPNHEPITMAMRNIQLTLDKFNNASHPEQLTRP